jgi:SsrA-binding protein
MEHKLITKNRKAYFDYHVLDTQIAGIKLLGSEVKSIRINGVNLNDSYCFIQNDEIFVKGINIPKLQTSEYDNHEPTRIRKLLLKKKEIKKLFNLISTEKVTIVPIEVLFNEHNLIKLNIAVCRGKKTYDKSKAIKERDIQRETKIF